MTVRIKQNCFCFVCRSYLFLTCPRFTNPLFTNPPFRPFTYPCFTNQCFTNPCFTNPPFTNPCFTNPPFTNPCFTNPVQSNPVHVLQYSYLCWTSAGEISSKLQRSRCLACRSGSPIFCPAAFIARFSLYYLYAARKTSGTERCFLPPPLTFELFVRITFTPIRLEVSNCDHVDRHVKKCQK